MSEFNKRFSQVIFLFCASK